jgi:hypothetical protein
VNLQSGVGTRSGMIYRRAMSSRPNVIINGNGPGTYNSLTNATGALIIAGTGSVVEGPLEFTTGADNVVVENLSVDVGDGAINKGITIETDAINAYSPYDTVWNTPIRNFVVNNVTTLNRNASSQYHGVKCENVIGCTVTNSMSLWGTHGFVGKFGTGFDFENLVSVGHRDDCLNFKAGTDGFAVVAYLSGAYANNITCASANPNDTNGVYVQAANGSISNVSLNNLTLDGVMTGLDLTGDLPSTGFGITGLTVNGLTYTAGPWMGGKGVPQAAVLVEGLVNSAIINGLSSTNANNCYSIIPTHAQVGQITINSPVCNNTARTEFGLGGNGLTTIVHPAITHTPGWNFADFYNQGATSQVIVIHPMFDNSPVETMGYERQKAHGAPDVIIQ